MEERRRAKASPLLLAAAVALTTLPALGQAPPASFYDGRSPDELRALATDRHNDLLVRRGAATRLVTVLADREELDAADAAARDFAENIDPRAASYAAGARRRHRAHQVALGALAFTLVPAGGAIVAARERVRGGIRATRRAAATAAAFLAFAGGVGGYLASTYENGNPAPFVLFAALMFPLVMTFRFWSAVGSPKRRAKAGRVVAALTASTALGFLVVEWVDKTFLEGFGL